MPDIKKMAGTGLILPYPFGYGAVAVWHKGDNGETSIL